MEILEQTFKYELVQQQQKKNSVGKWTGLIYVQEFPLKKKLCSL